MSDGEAADRLEGLRSAHARDQNSRSERISVRIEDFLEVILELENRDGAARVSDIANHLSVSRPTVAKMLARMTEDGWLHREPYRAVNLSPKGREHAYWMRKRHGVLVRFLKHLGTDDETAHFETEGIEHHLSESTVSAIAKLCERLEK
ncbi:MAG TPA: MarR family transcriptional regulator [Candidatus Thalassarchaeaceae archaeon]|nr:MAG TPA: MarR family transcriptional regulator [Candidatus Poseidoniales archaeon]HIH84897.1 MarR family transcriptional regulator [Candidatus Thalassarchaeaceae archaeon]